MMAIGKGAQQEILDQIKLVGVNNIIVKAKIDKKSSSDEEEEGGKEQRKQFSPGLTLLDAEGIKSVIPTVLKVSPEVTYETTLINDGKKLQARLNGITPDYFDLFNLKLASGNMFNNEQLEAGIPVCIIGPGINAKLFRPPIRSVSM